MQTLGSSQHPAGQPRAGHSLGDPADRRASCGDAAAGVEAVPGPAGRRQGSAQQRLGQTSANGPEVPASGQLAEGHGDQSATTVREKTERAAVFLEEVEAEQLREEVDGQLGRLEDLLAALRAQQNALEKCISLSKDFVDKYKVQAQWVLETKGLLASGVEPKAELYQKKAQLAKYKVDESTSVARDVNNLNLE
uniref:Uncharacterized protein n=1 Tax=Hippocampus comes TaxID=109280 RepID=A0A3Q2XWF0_HIPCM